MAFVTFSTRLFTGRVAAANTLTAFQVPAGHRVVIRDIETVMVTPGTSNSLAILLSTVTDLARVQVPSGATGASWEGRIVAHELEVVSVRPIGSDQAISMHGYLLTGAGGPLTVTALPADIAA